MISPEIGSAKRGVFCAYSLLVTAARHELLKELRGYGSSIRLKQKKLIAGSEQLR